MVEYKLSGEGTYFHFEEGDPDQYGQRAGWTMINPHSARVQQAMRNVLGHPALDQMDRPYIQAICAAYEHLVAHPTTTAEDLCGKLRKLIAAGRAERRQERDNGGR